MGNNIISDNWSLQNINELLLNGLSSDKVFFVKVNKKQKIHHWQEIEKAIVDIEALFDFITDIILRNQIIVDEEFTKAWKKPKSPLIKVTDANVIRPYPFLDSAKKLEAPRNELIQRLCITSSLRRDHAANVASWEKDRTVPDRYLSQTLWGGAGMLARAFVYEKAYTPHPVRRRLFQIAGVSIPSEDAVVRLNNFINEKRASILFSHLGHDQFYGLLVDMPALPIIVIQESNDIKDIMPVALQLREQYQELREWLSCYHQALSDGSYKKIKKFQEILHSISLYVDSSMGKQNSDSATFTMGIGVLKVALKGQPLNMLKNQFGVRSMINKLIIGNSGKAELKKFLKLFGHRNTVLGMKVLDHFSRKK